MPIIYPDLRRDSKVATHPVETPIGFASGSAAGWFGGCETACWISTQFSSADWKAGYVYELAFREFEITDTYVFDRPQAGRMWFEGVIRDHLREGLQSDSRSGLASRACGYTQPEGDEPKPAREAKPDPVQEVPRPQANPTPHFCST